MKHSEVNSILFFFIYIFHFLSSSSLSLSLSGRRTKRITYIKEGPMSLWALIGVMIYTRPISTYMYQNSYLAPRLGGIKQKKCIIHCWASRWFLLFYFPKPRSQIRILIYRNWSIGLAWLAEILARLQNTTKIIFPYVGDQLSQVKKIITSPTKQQEVQCNNKH